MWSRPDEVARAFGFDNAMGGGLGKLPEIGDAEPIVGVRDDDSRSFEKVEVERSI